MSPSPTPSPILYSNPHLTATILDIPRSLSHAQGPLFKKQILSTPALKHPYPSLEPKTQRGKKNVGESSIEELLLEKNIELVLEGVRAVYGGVWCLPRHEREVVKGKSSCEEERCEVKLNHQENESWNEVEDPRLIRNDNDTSIYITSSSSPSHSPSLIHIPPHSTALPGLITETLPLFHSHAPSFPLILLDPPWPNRSALRKGSYNLSYSTPTINSLLLSIPIPQHLEENGYVAVWVTNKPAFRTMLLGEEGRGGLFEAWGVELVEEWVWVKTTVSGEPMCELGGRWRRCYEVLLVARRKKSKPSEGEELDGDGDVREGVKRRIIFAVPDEHSRKPNLKVLFEELIEGTFRGLEIFARNLTEGWWGWGDEVLKFQGEEYWIEDKETEREEGI